MRTKAEIRTAFAETSTLDSVRSFFLVGIGGAGMSGVARMLRHRGYEVTGTDSTDSPLIAELRREGITVSIGHSGETLRPGMALVLSDAIPLDAPEAVRAQELDLPIVRRSQALGWLLRDKRLIAVTGTHGKTTTTAMIGVGLQALGLDPTIVVGAEVPAFGSAIVEGTSDLAVIEACEAYDSFHDFDPSAIVLTNLELDHIDFHENWENLRSSAVRFVQKLDAVPNGLLVVPRDDAGSQEVLTAARPAGAQVVAADDLPAGMTVGAPGAHNRQNAAAALAAIRWAAPGQDLTPAVEALATFTGAERRLQVISQGPITVLDDYAHHPTEIRASLQAIRERYQGRLIVVFQPHLYSRTEPLIAEFAEALSAADLVVLTDIYPAREDPIPGVSSVRIAERITVPCRYVPSRHLLPRTVAGLVEAGDVVVGMGAGNIGEFAPAFVQELARPASPERIAVFYGGDSAEREVSLLSGRAVARALQSRGYHVDLVDLTESLLSGKSLAWLTGPDRPDVAFLEVHGTHAEDGAIQGLLELLHIPYTGSGVQASAIAMDKDLTKQVLTRAGIPVPQGVRLGPNDAIPNGLKAPLVVKPNEQGSTIGLSFVDDLSDLVSAVAYARQFGREVLVEERIIGVEISVPVLEDRCLPPVEILPRDGDYDFANKYTPGATDELCPARLTPAVTKHVQDLALQAHRALGCRGVTRTDMIVTGETAVVLEVNTLPGMTATSLVPNAAAAAGMSFADLVVWMVENAAETARP